MSNLERKIKIKDEYLKLIIDLGYDYDGYNTVENLKLLIDELIEYARKALNSDDKSVIYSSLGSENADRFNILIERLKE